MHVAKKRNKITTVFCKIKVIARGRKSALFGWKNQSCKQKSREGCSWFCTKIIGMELICCSRYVSCNMVEWIPYVVRWVFFTFFHGLGKVFQTISVNTHLWATSLPACHQPKLAKSVKKQKAVGAPSFMSITLYTIYVDHKVPWLHPESLKALC